MIYSTPSSVTLSKLSDKLTTVYCDNGEQKIWYGENINNKIDNYKIPNEAFELVINHIDKEFEIYDIENLENVVI